MNFQYLEAASARIKNKPMLINLISRRVRQLNRGMRPLVKPDHPHQENLDIALKEVAQGLLDAELRTTSPTTTSGGADLLSLP